MKNIVSNWKIMIQWLLWFIQDFEIDEDEEEEDDYKEHNEDMKEEEGEDPEEGEVLYTYINHQTNFGLISFILISDSDGFTWAHIEWSIDCYSTWMECKRS